MSINKTHMSMSFHESHSGPLRFEVCQNTIDEHFCPPKPHGHLWASGELPIVIFPHLTNKTIALTVLFHTLDLFYGPGALAIHPGIELVEQQIAESGLPEDEEAT